MKRNWNSKFLIVAKGIIFNLCSLKNSKHRKRILLMNRKENQTITSAKKERNH